ncbi:MAG: right-handed parallel beta-helix repeat-containing protein [Planctomycetota bacterium]|jgi:hypothetical protein
MGCNDTRRLLIGAVSALCLCCFAHPAAGAGGGFAVPVAPSDRMPEVVGRTELFVAPDGKAAAAGTREAPLDIVTAFADATRVRPGAVVWILPGRYDVGEVALKVSGAPGRPVVYRAVPGGRATVVGHITWTASHAWLWGVEVTGPPRDGITIRKGDGVRLINLVLHDNGASAAPARKKPTGMGIGGWDVGDDHEYYGNVIYHNGVNTLDHGIYSQNTARHTTKRYLDNIIFENAGCGIHCYGQSPSLANLHVEGNICFATTQRPGSAGKGQMNVLVGGYKPLTDVVVRDNCTWHPQAGRSKRGVDVGYIGKGHRNITIEGNYFTCGSHAMELKGVSAGVTVRNNTFWAPEGMVQVTLAPDADRATIRMDGNTYVANGTFDLAAWRKATGFDASSRVVAGRGGRPAGLHVFRRVNRYEPSRVHLAVYNWDRRREVAVDVSGVAAPGSAYRVVNVLDLFGEPVAEGKVAGGTIRLPMAGHRYEPEFGAYLLFLSKPGRR